MDVTAIAEDAQAYLPVRASTQREDAGDVVLRHVPHSPQFWYGSATRPRFDAAAADERIRGVRAWFAARGRAEFMWMVGESATPPELVDRLIATGARLDGEDGSSWAMVLDREPPPGPADVVVRRIATFDDFRASMRITLEDADAETWAATEARLEEAWAEARDDDRMYVGFLALLDGAPVSSAQLVWLTNGLPYLGGATTLRAARGRGAFRALVRARWDEAVRHGQPILLVQAGPLSAPTLGRLGFRRRGRVTVLRDRSA